ncbi:MAG: alanine racemase, partial [Saprospiraceae bacterium]|nr:alanine racemase [Saprospiraceae bacterium]
FDWRQHTILVKGARRFGLEQLASRLSKKIHLTVLEVRLQSLRHNLSQYRQLLHTNTKIMVMVKAAAYGSGAIEVARVLEKDRVDYLAVAYADEGIELREGGIELPIMVLNPEEAVIDAMIRYRLEPEIYSLTLLQQFAQASRYQDGAFPIHIKFDTGMHRLGFEAKDLPLLLQNLKNNPQLKVHTCLSHLAASEAPEHDEFSLRQIRQFEAMYQQLVLAIGYQPIRHMLNSSGISRFPEHQMDMVRLGIGLYGIDANPDMQPKLRTVLQLKASVSQVKHLPQGETVGYGRKGRAEEDKKIATISIGYADGLWRAAGNGKFSVSIRGQLAPTIGNVCMDMCMVDVSHIPDVQIGDAVLIFGPQLPVHRLADALHTIPYEILTSISGRVRRIYLQD